MMLLVAPSQSIELALQGSRVGTFREECAVGSWELHALLVADSLRGWLEYMVWIEKRLREQVSPIPKPALSSCPPP